MASLIDLNPEELERVAASTWRSSTPLTTTPAVEIKSLTAAVEALASKIEQHDGQLAKRLDDITERLDTVESSYVLDQGHKRSVTFGDLPKEQAPDDDELMRALEEIESRTRQNSRRLTQEHEKPKVRPTTFDGKAAWEDYLAQFEIVAEINHWNEATKATYLAVSLSGPAREVLGDLTSSQRKNFNALTVALGTRFGTANRTEMFRASIKSRRRQKDETLPELAQALRRLTRYAYPEAPAELREVLARDHFIDALADFDTRWKIKQGSPTTLNKALDIAVELEAFQLANRQRASNPQSRAIQVAAGGDKSLANEVAELREQLKRIQGQDRRRREGCYTCGALDHYRRDCPEARRDTAAPRAPQQRGHQRQRWEQGVRQQQQQQNQSRQPQQNNNQQRQTAENEHLPSSRA